MKTNVAMIGCVVVFSLVSLSDIKLMVLFDVVIRPYRLPLSVASITMEFFFIMLRAHVLKRMLLVRMRK